MKGGQGGGGEGRHKGREQWPSRQMGVLESLSYCELLGEQPVWGRNVDLCTRTGRRFGDMCREIDTGKCILWIGV